MSEIKNHTNKVYTVHNNASLLQEISKVVAVIAPYSISFAGFNDKGKLLIIDQLFNETGHAWEHDFYTARLTNRAIDQLVKKATAIFIDVNRSTVVPKSLYNESEAETLLRSLYFIEKEEATAHAALRDKVWYIYSFGNDIKELLQSQLPKAKILPLPAYQFSNQIKGDLLQCCIVEHRTYCNLYKNGALCWQQIIDHETAEDIAYVLKKACIENGVDEHNLTPECAVCDSKHNSLVADLLQYFPQKEDDQHKYEPNTGDWKYTINLFQSLYSCVS